jgi:hypothetical protein
MIPKCCVSLPLSSAPTHKASTKYNKLYHTYLTIESQYLSKEPLEKKETGALYWNKALKAAKNFSQPKKS